MNVLDGFMSGQTSLILTNATAPWLTASICCYGRPRSTFLPHRSSTYPEGGAEAWIHERPGSTAVAGPLRRPLPPARDTAGAPGAARPGRSAGGRRGRPRGLSQAHPDLRGPGGGDRLGGGG